MGVPENEKVAAVHVETDEYADVEKPGVQRDYSGAVVNLDPREQALVKKLDWHIMVCQYGAVNAFLL